MTYTVKEIFYSLQGEGARTGRPAVFCRFSGCNAWNGLEKDKSTSSCPFCDTDFVGYDGQNGGKYQSAEQLVNKINLLWPENASAKALPYLVFSGGEPALQVDDELITAAKKAGFEIAIETNGSLDIPHGIDWVCVSPKQNLPLQIIAGNELKLLYPQNNCTPEAYQSLDFQHFYLQAIDDTQKESNIKKTLNYCLAHPQWKLSCQLHKILNID